MATYSGQTFGDIVTRIGDSYRSDAEVAALVTQLLNSGRTRFTGHWAGKRIVVRPSLATFLQRVRSEAGNRGNDGKTPRRQGQAH